MMEVAAELVHYHIERKFPNSVRAVHMEKNIEKDTHDITVRFKNGHRLSANAHDAFTEAFMAQVAMVWDLPEYHEPKE